METNDGRDERRRSERLLGKPRSPALDALEKLKGLQKSCVESMASLRVVKAQVLGEDEGAARFVPLQQVVDTQAKKIKEVRAFGGKGFVRGARDKGWREERSDEALRILRFLVASLL